MKSIKYLVGIQKSTYLLGMRTQNQIYFFCGDESNRFFFDPFSLLVRIFVSFSRLMWYLFVSYFGSEQKSNISNDEKDWCVFIALLLWSSSWWRFRRKRRRERDAEWFCQERERERCLQDTTRVPQTAVLLTLH